MEKTMTELTDTLIPSTTPEATPGAKMLYLIKRKPTTSREELVAHWVRQPYAPGDTGAT